MARVPVLYTEQDTVLHRRDPRVKVILFALLLAYPFAAPSWQWMLILTGIGAAACVLARVPVKYLLWALVIVQLPNFVGILSIPVIGDLLEGSLQYDKEMADGLKLVFAWAGALLLSFGLFSTMKVDELTDGLRGLRLPEAACFAVGYAFLLLYLSLSDIFRITDAMKIKGVDLETKNPFRLLASLPRLMIPALFTTVWRGTTMIAVLEMRGFSFSKRRKKSERAKFDVGDATLLFCGLLIFGAALGARLDLLPWQFTVPKEEKKEGEPQKKKAKRHGRGHGREG
jgi:energy-coupling factor transport system permease protein